MFRKRKVGEPEKKVTSDEKKIEDDQQPSATVVVEPKENKKEPPPQPPHLTPYERAKALYPNTTTATSELMKRKIKDDRAEFSRGIRTVGYHLFKDFSLFFSTVIGRFVGGMIGLFVLNYIITIWWIQRQPTCPKINGKVCNAPHGYCSDTGNCQCVSMLHSGKYCEYSACDDCDGGRCFPWMKKEFIIPDCRWENPTVENGYKESYTGWQNPVCKTKLAELKHRLFDLGENLTDQERSTIPMCLCETPKYGRGCKYDACPQNVAQEICSKHGNKSVGLFNNDTLTGLGCQCKTIFQILDFADEFNPEMIEAVQKDFQDVLLKLYCADEVVRTLNSFYLKIRVSRGEQLSPLKCYCDEETTGYGCEDDICPKNPLGDVCSLNGAPNLGFGLEFYSKTKKHSRCRANCVDGKKWCPLVEMCREDCLIEDNCPPERPYRCRNQKCVSNKTTIHNGEQGYLEHISPNVVKIGNITLDLIQITTPLVGINLVNGSAIVYYSTEEIYLNSTNNNWVASLPIAQEEIITEVEYRFTILGNISLFLYTDGEDVLQGEYTLVRKNGDRIRTNFGERQIIFFDGVSSLGYLVFQNNSQQFAWISSDEFVPLSECTFSLESSPRCEFYLQSDGNYSKINSTMTFPLPTIEETEFLKITYVTSATVLYPISMPVLDEAYFLIKRKEIIQASDFLIVWDNSVLGGYLEYYMQEQLTSHSPICTPYLDKSMLFGDGFLNQSQFNRKWFTDPVHPITTDIGDYVVYYSFVLDSWERGQIVSQDQELENIKKGSLIEISGSVKRAITKREHNLLGGLVECPPWLFFYKNKCVWPSFSHINRLEEVNCSQASDSIECLNTKPQCEVYANIFTLIRYIYRTDGNFTYPVGDVVSADNVTQVFFTLQDNQTQVPVNWTIGEYHPQAFSIDVLRLASSNPDTINNTKVSTLKWWESESWDHYTWMELQSLQKITLALIHLRSNTVRIGNISVVTPVFFQLFIRGDWENHTIFDTQVNDTFLLPINKSTNRIRLLGLYRFSIYEFNAYTIQDCRANDTTALVTGIIRNVRNDTMYKASKGMNYSEDCLAFQSTPSNGICEDEYHLRALYNVSTLQNYSILDIAYKPLQYYTIVKLEQGGVNVSDLPSSVSVSVVNSSLAIINSDVYVQLGNETKWNSTHFLFYSTREAYFNYSVIGSGYDYLDCGPSTRPFNTTLPGVDCIFSNVTIMEYLNYTWSVNVTRRRDYLLPWSCPFGNLCVDGSCFEFCSDSETWHCDGNGCQKPESGSGFHKCACKQGRGGLECQFKECLPPVTDIRTYDSTLHDPHRDCRIDPGLKIKPPASLLKRDNVDNKEVERLNRGGVRRLNSLDVRNILVKPHHGPYGIPLSVRRLSNNLFVNSKGEKERQMIYSDCPYARKDSMGQKKTLDDDVEERTSRGVVKKWRIYYNEVTKKNETFPWSSETAYDDFNQRCPNGACEPGLEYCIDETMCSGNGKLLVDGTCECNYGWTTALYTESNTKSKQVSYFFDYAFNLTNPTLWDLSNNNWRDYMGEYCRARDCTIQDCSPPLGCYTGTPPDFKDSHISCPDGGCAINSAECTRGVNKTPKIPCSGNGIHQKRDYRVDQEEWYCQCGFLTVPNATQTTQLTKNGFGGLNCDQYTCSESVIKFSRFNERTKKAFQDKFGRTLRGVWEGYCGAHIGPDPNELPLWQMCCPTAGVYKPCNNVPCEIDGKVVCKLSEECIPSGGVPKVYVCNKKGTGRGDGSCDCNRDESTGTGYTTDYNLGEDNCFKEVNCPISAISGTPCNKMPACSDPTNWLRGPNHPYFNQQARVILTKEGKGFTNESLVREFSDITEIENLKLQSFVAEGREVQEALSAYDTCIYIHDVNDTNNSFPYGMTPYPPSSYYTIQPYQKSYESPYLLNYSTVNESVLKNDIMTALDFTQLILWQDYVILQNETSFNFSEEVKITAIRIHARGLVMDGITTTLKFYSSSGVACPLVLIADDKWNWTEQYCTSIYEDYDYNALGNAYLDVCDDVSTSACSEFKRKNCPGRYLPVNELHVTPRGCDTECCILVQESAAPDVFISQVVFVTDSNLTNVAFDEVQFYGYTRNTVKPVPPGLFPGGVVNGTCSERPDLRYAEQYLGNDKSYFVLDGEFNITDARIEARRRGAWVAAPISAVGLDYQNDALKQACLKAVGLNKFCFIEMGDWNFSYGINNISYFFEPSCTAFGCFFGASNDVDLYAARNSSIYNETRWAGASHKKWADVLTNRELVWWRQNFRMPYPVELYVNDRGFFSTVSGGAIGEYLTSNIFDGYNQQRATFANLLNYWRPHDFGLQTTPEHPNYLWDEYNPLDTMNMELRLYNIPYTDISSHQVNINFRKITFQPTRDIWERTNVIDFNWPAYQVPYLSACSAVYTRDIPTRGFGYCGDYLRDAFPFDFFGVELFNWLDKSNKTGGWQSPNNWHKFNQLDLPLAKNVKSILASRSSYVVLKTRALNGTISKISVQLSPVRPYNVIGTLLEIQVFPARKFRKTRFRVKGQPRDNDVQNGSEHTMGWGDKAWMGMRVFTHEAFRIEVNSTGIDLTSPAVPAFMKPFVGTWITWGGTNYSLPSAEVVKPPSVYLGTLFELYNASTSFTFDDVNAKFITTESLGRSIIPCRDCEIKRLSNWNFNPHTFTKQGGFPKQASAVRDSGIVILNWKGVNIRLDDMPNNYKTWHGFARQSVANLLPDYLNKFVKDWCAAVSSSTGYFHPMPCGTKLPVVAQYDYTKHVALPGRTGDVCGHSSRLGGYAQPGVTCIDGFPLANATLFPFEHLLLEKLIEGVLNLFIKRIKYDYDKAIQFYKDKPIVWALPKAWEYWYKGFVDRAGYSLKGNSYDWLDFSLKKHFGYDCGPRVSERTGLIQTICANDITACDPDLVFEPVRLESDVPGIYSPSDVNVTNPICGTSIRPSSFLVRDRFGGLTPGFSEQFEVLETFDNGGILILTIGAYTQVFNTGKSSHMFVFEGNFTVAGKIEFECASNCVGNATIWVSKLDTTYTYPPSASKIELLTVEIVNNAVEYEIYHYIEQNATYQILGWDFNLTTISIITLNNAVVTDEASMETCARLIPPILWEAPPAVVSQTPENRCIYNKMDLIYYGDDIGKCNCAHLLGGPACDCPAIRRNVCGGFGDFGLIQLGNGKDATAGSDGCYIDNKKADCKCLDVGKYFFTRLNYGSAYDYSKVFVLENIYDEFAYVVLNASTGVINKTSVENAVYLSAKVLISFINGDELDDYLSLTMTKPVLMDLTRTGVSDIVWNTRGIHLDGGGSLSGLGQIPILDVGNWTSDLIDMINFDNKAYNRSEILHDGSFVYYTNITTWNTTLSEIKYVWIYADSTNNTSSNCMLMRGKQWICSAGDIGFDVLNVSEIQVYDIGTKPIIELL